MQGSTRRGAIILVALLAAMVGVVALPGSAAHARPKNNEVTATSYIWNCPTGAPGCYPGAQTRVGDVRVGDPLTDVCQVTFGTRRKSLVYNRTDRGGAADRTGFLYRDDFRFTPNTDNCYTAGIANAPDHAGVVQRLCPWDACGPVFRIPSNYTDWVLRDLCTTFISGKEYRLTVAYNINTRGPLTAGFVRPDEDLRTPWPPTENNCEIPF